MELVRPEIDLETLGLEIMSHSILGSEDRIEMFFLSAEDNWAGGFNIDYSTSSYYFKWCTPSPIDFPVALPTAKVWIWRINLKRTPVLTIIIYCNDVLVLERVMSDDTCSWSSSKRDTWGRRVEKIYFGYTDTASNYYRPYFNLPGTSRSIG